MIALIDGDIVAWRAAATAEQDDFWIAKARANETIRRILATLGTDKYMMFLSGEENFRKEIDPSYKANRTAPSPRHLEDLKVYLVEEWAALVCDGIEADDALGINQNEDTIICSIDKDLLQIPGKHYNFVREETYDISEFTGLFNFYKQMLTGDRTDNVTGIPGVGPVKASRILAGIGTERESFARVRAAFNDDAEFLRTGDLIYILKQEGERWSRNKKSWMLADPFEPEQGVVPGLPGLETTESMESTGMQTTDGSQSFTISPAE